MQFIGLFLNKGFRIRALKILNVVYLQFLYNFHKLDVRKVFFDFFNTTNLDMGEFINLYNAFPLFTDWSKALIWRIEENLPMIKVISKKKNIKKKKKKKRKKFLLEYRYIKNNYRFQVALRWLSLIIKTSSNKLYLGILKAFIPFIINPKQSKFVILKKKIYKSLLLSIQ